MIFISFLLLLIIINYYYYLQIHCIYISVCDKLYYFNVGIATKPKKIAQERNVIRIIFIFKNGLKFSHQKMRAVFDDIWAVHGQIGNELLLLSLFLLFCCGMMISQIRSPKESTGSLDI